MFLIVAMLSALVVGGAGVDAAVGNPLCHDKGGVSEKTTSTPYGKLPVCNDDLKPE